MSRTSRTQLKKAAHKVSLEVEHLYQTIDASNIAHIAINDKRGPSVIPMLAWREDDNIFIHGAKNSPMIRYLKSGANTCLTFTLFDGWVLARSAFHHSAHYRCAMVFGQFTTVEDNAEKSRLLDIFIDHIAPGRSKEVRTSSERELTATELLVMPLAEASLKISDRGVNDDIADMDHDVWAGVLPYHTQIGPAITDSKSQVKRVPDYLNLE
ncbi:flavin-nucleotide-binding protein [Veronia pacifica]|uniref:Flavin-nucleotide-binding protein n=1 Tax=Veronia pacifica TaxID=1080227 RepID=A0A1C3EPK5_9GAMM|nr:flavin-nucleotide-binding protein [Veronia pacifica]